MIATVATATVAKLKSSALAGNKNTKPNILYIMCDDHAAHAIGAYGSRLAKVAPTDNIDRIAEEGALLENCFCTNSICAPSRATILTGQHSQTNGVLTLHGKLPLKKQYLPRLMGEAGYETAMIGKWHLKTLPEAFDYYKVLKGQGSYFNPKFKEKNLETGEMEWVKNEGHSSDCITDSSLKWLKNRESEKPFFLMHHFKAPHGHWENAPRFDKLFQDMDIPEPESLWKRPTYNSLGTKGENVDYSDGLGTSISKRNRRRNMGQMLGIDQDLPDDEYTHASYQRYLKRYLRCVAGINENVGRILNYLEQEGILDNTVIIYTSDQGMMLGEHDYIDKRWMYEESLRMPLLARYPKLIPPGTRSDAIVNNTDFAPTILDLGQAPVPSYMQGRSFLPILEGKTPKDWRKASYYRYWMHMKHHDNPAHFGIRTKRYKLIFYYGRKAKGVPGENMETAPAWELYDLKKDPHEMNNVYDNPEYAGVLKKLKKELKNQREKHNETDKKYPGIQKVIDEHWSN